MLKETFQMGMLNPNNPFFNQPSAGCNSSVNQRPQTLPEGGVEKFCGVSLTDLAERLSDKKYGTPIPVGQRHSAVFSLAQMLAGCVPDVPSIQFAMRGIAPDYDYENWARDIADGCSPRYRYSVCTKELKEMISELAREQGIVSGANVSSVNVSGAVSGQQTVNAFQTANSTQQTIQSSTSSDSTMNDTLNIIPQGYDNLVNHQIALPEMTRAPKMLKKILSHYDERLWVGVLPVALQDISLYSQQWMIRDMDGLKTFPTLMVTVLGTFLSNKSILRKLQKAICKPLLDDDKAQRQAVEAWRQKGKQVNGQKTLSAKPVCSPVFVGPKCSFNALLEYLAAADEKHSMMMFTEEISEFMLAARSMYNTNTETMRKAFDGADLNNDSLSEMSYNGSASARLNYQFAGQYDLFWKFVGSMGVADGTVSRLYMALMRSTILEKRPKFVEWEDDELKEVWDYLAEIQKKTSTPAVVDLKDTRRMLNSLIDNLKEEAKQDPLNQDGLIRVMFSIRQAETALRFAYVVYLMSDCQETKFVLDVARYFFENGTRNIYCLCRDRVGDGDSIKRVSDNYENYVKASKSAAVLNSLPETFTRDEFKASVKANGMSDSDTNIRTLLSRFKTGKKIKSAGKDAFKKIK